MLTKEQIQQHLSRPLDTKRSEMDVVVSFMNEWKRQSELLEAGLPQDFEAMMPFVQRTWIEANHVLPKKKNDLGVSPEALLRGMFAERHLEWFQIKHTQMAYKHPSEPPLSADYAIDVVIEYCYTIKAKKKTPIQSKKKKRKVEWIDREIEVRMKVRCLRESKPYTLDPNGEWGVNPSSMTRQEAL